MRDQWIEFVAWSRHDFTTQIKTAYTLRPDRPHQWLQRACIWVLKKLCCYYEKGDVAYTKTVVNTGDLMERIYKQRISVEDVFNVQATRLLIGAQDFEEMMLQPQIMQHVTFRVGDAYRSRNQIFGMDIEIIPWMRGVLVIK